MQTNLTSKPSVSVIVPFYNRSNLILECLQSIINQTHAVNEIIIVDDCSIAGESEKLGEIVKQVNNDSAITVTIIALPENKGVSYARNMGVSKASSELIAFLDSDDYWDSKKIELQVRYFNEHPDCDAVHTGTVVFNSFGEIARYTNKPENLSIKDLLKSSHVTPPSLMLKKSVFNALNGFDSKIKFCEDYDFSIRLLLNDYKIHCINKPLTYVRRGDYDKLTNNIWHYFIWHMNILIKYRREYIIEEGWFALNKYTAKYLYSTAKRIGGIGNLLTIIAFFIYPSIIFNKQKLQ